MKSTALKTTTGVVGVLVFLAIVIAVNVLLSGVRIRKDVTKEGLYTLSEGTKTLLGKLDRDVTLKFYFSRSADNLPEPVKQYARRILDLLEEVETHSGGRVVVERLDPEPDSTDEEWAQRYGLVPQNLPMMGGAGFYLGLVAVSGAKESVIPFFSPSSEPQLEYLVTRMVAEVTTPAKPKIGLLSRLPVVGSPGMFAMSRGVEPWVFLQELRNTFDVVNVNPADRAIPDDIDTLLVIHPKEATATALYAIDQFVLRGGRLVAFIDPVSIADAENSMERDISGRLETRSDLNQLTKAWGIEMDATKVVADMSSGTRVGVGDGQADRNPAWLSLRAENMDRKEIATAGLDFVMLPFAGFFTGTPVEGLTMTTILRSGPNAGTLDAADIALGDPRVAKRIKDPQPEPKALAIRLEGRFKTAFPEGRPKDPTEAPVEEPDTHLAASTKDGVVVLVADTDVLYDRFSVQRMNFLGRSIFQPVNDNLNFVVNTTEQLSGSDLLIGLRSRGSYERPFTRVLAMEEEAATIWREKELALQDKLTDVQNRLNELQTAKSTDAQYIVSPEQQKEIDGFRKELFETRKELKEVRKNLRQDIEALGLQVKLANIALMPAVIALVGIGIGLHRRSRATSR